MPLGYPETSRVTCRIMETLLAAASGHAYQLLFLVVLLEAIGFPVPAAIALVVSGGAIALGDMDPMMAPLTAVGAMLLGDNLMYLVGRFSGWWLLGLLCRLSLNPENCIMNSARMFHRRGRIVLIVAKFVPGINTMAPPLAGSMNMPFLQFELLDIGGTLLYIGAWMAVGYLFSDALESIKAGFATAGSAVEWLIGAALVLWLANRLRVIWQEKKLGAAPTVSVTTVATRLADSDALVFDVRSHGYYDSGAVRIPGAQRLDPHGMLATLSTLPRDKDIFLYCT